MLGNNKMNEIGIKNCMCYYFGDMIIIDAFNPKSICKDHINTFSFTTLDMNHQTE